MSCKPPLLGCLGRASNTGELSFHEASNLYVWLMDQIPGTSSSLFERNALETKEKYL